MNYENQENIIPENGTEITGEPAAIAVQEPATEDEAAIHASAAAQESISNDKAVAETAAVNTEDGSENITEAVDTTEESASVAESEYTLEGDISALLKELPSLRETLGGGINAARYGELRRMGLSAREAYLAASSRVGSDSRSHMVTGVPLGAHAPTAGMSSSEMELARGLFSGMSESEIKRLYAKVTK